MKFYKYRQMFSHGYTNWEYIHIPDCYGPKDIEEYLENKNLLDKWSEHFRKVEYKRVTKLPKDISDRMIDEAKRTINNAKTEIEYYQSFIKKMGKI